MTAPTEPEQAPVSQRPIGIGTIIVFGVFLIPFALILALNSYGPVTVGSALRMAASQVAAHTIVILTSITVVVLTIRRRYSVRAIFGAALFAVFAIIFSLDAMSNAGNLLLSFLSQLGIDQP